MERIKQGGLKVTDPDGEFTVARAHVGWVEPSEHEEMNGLDEVPDLCRLG